MDTASASNSSDHSYAETNSNNYWYILAVIVTIVVILLYYQDKKGRLKFYVKYIIFGMHFLIFLFPYMVVGLLRPGSLKNMLFIGWCLEPLSYLMGFEWEIRNPENMPKDGISAICVANHQAMLDLLGHFHMWYTLSIPSAVMVRKEFFWAWPVGLLMWLNGVVFIDRTPGSTNTRAKLTTVGQKLQNEKTKIWIYVEGTRNKTPDRLLPFKKGAFRMAIDAQVPIVPVVFSPYYFISWTERYFRSGKASMTVLEPIPTKGLTASDTDDLVKRTYDVMKAKYTELKEEVKNLY